MQEKQHKTIQIKKEATAEKVCKISNKQSGDMQKNSNEVGKEVGEKYVRKVVFNLAKSKQGAQRETRPESMEREQRTRQETMQ